MAYTTTNEKQTAHTCNDGAGPHFGKKTLGCPRCDELSAGAAPRQWNGQAERANRNAYAARLDAEQCVGHAPQLNPGGYCTVCGKGRDFS